MSFGPLDAEPAPRRLWPALLRWAMAALVVISAHGSLAWFALSWRPNEAAAGAPEPAVMIELAAVSVAPESAPSELPPAPQPTETEPEPTPPEPEPEPVKEPEPPPPEPVPEPEPEPVKLPEPEIKLPELPQLPEPAAVLAPPPPPKIEKPKVVERKPVPPKPKPKLVERRKPVERQKPKMEQAAAPPPSAAAAAAPSSAIASLGRAEATPDEMAAWRGRVSAHISRFARQVQRRVPSVVIVPIAFSVDRGGQMLVARLARSSGDAELDAAALAILQRANPVPAPPAGRGTIALTIPVRFTP
ncbi:TonB family protein [Bosea caraganae]|uniref:TonB family protein n=1 Tax=Bosea caraganae TaxID=2763117 RepID=A0A370L858_9HYPH|nr:TonB family protein [Bosea caraganae]RDJ25115.1 TonB family protein [Bosea caraganae]RDJ26225.1 TonB family protein [Bosea caraganae]